MIKKMPETVKVFWIIFICMMIVMLPSMVSSHGLFLYPSDYTFQQIPFYKHGADTVRNTGIGWDWYTDLGTDFLASYSYYLSGSVFFWMLSVLGSHLIIYFMPVMIAVKVALGAVGAFIFIRRYVIRSEAVFLGAFMYAFSGFQISCIVYNSFYDVTAIFPFVLLSFELLVTENRKGIFAVCTGIAAVTNYFFFVGTAVFVTIYYTVKCICGDFKFTVRSFVTIVAEAIIGTGLAAIILIPTYVLVSSADRLGDMLYGVNLLSYDDNTIIPRILQGIFIMPDPNPGAMLFKSVDNTHNWASNSLYLPVFTIVGVSVFIKQNSRNWISQMLKISLVMALIPVLNSVFSLFNSSYYARWFYMPVLLMSLATSKAIDEDYNLISGIKIQSAALGIIVLISCLPDEKPVDYRKIAYFPADKNIAETAVQIFGMNKIPMVFWQTIAFSVIFLLVVYVYNSEKNKNGVLKKTIAAVMLLTVITSAVYIKNGTEQNGYDKEKCLYSLTEYCPELDSDDVYRISHTNNYSSDNFSMVWRYMNAGCYHSVESNESDDFYQAVQGKKRLMKSEYREEDYPVYGLLSVKYLFNISTNDDLNVEIVRNNTPGFSLYDKQGCYYIYKNDYFVPFGFMYDYCIDDETLEEYLEENTAENRYQYKKLVMMRALVLSEDDIQKYSGYITKLPEDMLENLNENSYFSDCNDRNTETCSSFEYDSKGFIAEITTDRPGLVYFSVPCSAGWSANVNGRNTEIIKAHYGLTAVPVESGENSIEFKYETPGLKTGIIISAMSLAILIVYIIIIEIFNGNKLRRNDEKKNKV